MDKINALSTIGSDWIDWKKSGSPEDWDKEWVISDDPNILSRYSDDLIKILVPTAILNYRGGCNRQGLTLGMLYKQIEKAYYEYANH